MTIFDYAKQASSITLGTFFEHIMNPSASGGGVIYTEVIELQEADVEVLEEVDTLEYLVDADADILEELEDKQIILEEKEEIIDAIC